ncbi:MAG TPA: pyridoxamine 5'-phosphate oxidase family protein [Firmicutes bacterium]|nr:pyridoxamine 5'-phosphate oxidase family protein [Bacillota bacterium]
MFRQMRRKNQQLSLEECSEILVNGSSGVLALEGDDGYPYAVPLSFVYNDKKIFFHSAKTGHKIDSIKSNDKASFCVIARDDVRPEEYTSYFKSVIAFGKIRILKDEEEIRKAIALLAIKYNSQDSIEKRERAIEAGYANLCMLELKVEHLTGKQAKELIDKK